MDYVPDSVLDWSPEWDFDARKYEVQVTLETVNGGISNKKAYFKESPKCPLIYLLKSCLGAEAVLCQMNDVEYLLIPHDSQEWQLCKIISDKTVMRWDSTVGLGFRLRYW